ncbi:MAG: hydrolase [Clostridiales bacterium]|nr:hydrolase [Clostridiales bacterium]
MKRILIFGDSNTWGYDHTQYIPELDTCRRMREDEHWPGRVRALLGDGFDVVTDALNGRTIMVEDPYFPLRRGITGLRVALDAHAPLDLTVLQLGCNELKRHFNLSAGMIAKGMDMLVRECEQRYYGYPAPKVLLIAPAPTHPDIGKLRSASRFGDEAYQKSLQLGALYCDIAERHGCGFIDCAELGFEINDFDGLHYSRADHAKLAPVVAEKIREMLA